MGSPSSSSTMEIILPLSAQKHDPAWKHCHMIKRGEKTHLKCIYCLKVFSGGGIHRIKEHLACQKGNASRCPKVLPEVRDAMRESLEGVVIKKRKKQKLAEEVKKLNPVSQPDALLTHVELDVGSPLSAVPISIMEQGFCNQDKEDTPFVNVSKRGRKKKAETSLPSYRKLDIAVIENTPVVATAKDQAYMAIGKFLFEAGVPLDATKSPHFRSMIDAIASAGPGLGSPSYHDVRGWILKRNLDETRAKLQQLRGVWARNGCSVLVDEYITKTNRILINFLVYCYEGMVFLKSIDASEIVTSAGTLYELLKHVVEEVGVEDVIQVITKNSDIHAAAGRMLMETFPTVFWTPCSIQIVDSILSDFRKLNQIGSIIQQAQTVTSFIYSHAPVLNMTRKLTGGKELVHLSISSAATDFSTLKALVSLKDNLHAMVTSKEWMDSSYSKVPGSLSVVDFICNPDFWSSCSTIVKLTESFLRVLRIADSGTRPAMSYIYVSMHRAKQRIRKELKQKKYYMPFWDIIDSRWDKEFPCPLHLAGFFFNPRLFYKIKGEIPKIMSGVLDCIERLVPDVKIQDKINKELGIYKYATGDFGRNMVIRARDSLLPAEWWSTYGAGCPNLTRLAVRILSQTCSARGCDRCNIPFEQVHSQRKNSLEKQRFSDLIFVRYNLRLHHRSLLRNTTSDPLSADGCIGYLEDWLVEKENMLAEGISSTWTDLNQPMVNDSFFENGNAEDDDPLPDAFSDEEIPRLCVEDKDSDDAAEEYCSVNDEPRSHSYRHVELI